jgi:3-keto-5-aminohexanoate cleavage enzyme
MLEYNVKPEIEVFDAAMLYNAVNLAKRGLISRRCMFSSCMGIPNAPCRPAQPAGVSRRANSRN